MFRIVSLSMIRSFSLYTQQWFMSYRFAESLRAGSEWNLFHPDPARNLSAKLYDIYHCCVYSEKLLMMDRASFQNKFENLVHLVGFILRKPMVARNSFTW